MTGFRYGQVPFTESFILQSYRLEKPTVSKDSVVRVLSEYWLISLTANKYWYKTCQTHNPTSWYSCVEYSNPSCYAPVWDSAEVQNKERCGRSNIVWCLLRIITQYNIPTFSHSNCWISGLWRRVLLCVYTECSTFPFTIRKSTADPIGRGV
jgi:hypothetical protein